MYEDVRTPWGCGTRREAKREWLEDYNFHASARLVAGSGYNSRATQLWINSVSHGSAFLRVRTAFASP